ncbi:MAG: extracellular solute-binding protein [Spirochaetales bacterium]|nr:extracellular solute-binding protein [Spirochaetales bacterium]
MRKGINILFVLLLAFGGTMLSAEGQQDQSSGSTVTVRTTNGPSENRPWEIERHKKLLEDFFRLNPLVKIEAGEGRFDRQSFAVKLAGHQMEDAFLVSFTEPQFLIGNGYVSEITEYIKKWDKFDQLNPDLLDIVSDDQGRIYGIPVGGYSIGLLYNRRLFEEAGLDPDSPPRTWDEVREYANIITAKHKDVIAYADLSRDGQGGWYLVSHIYSRGGDLVVKNGDKWKATFNTPEARAALEMLKEMRWDDEVMGQQQLLAVKDVLPMLSTGRVAMAMMAGDNLRTMKEQYEAPLEDFGMGPLPQEGGNATLAGGAAWMFSPNLEPEVLEAAVEWTLFQTFDNYESDIMQQAGRGQLVGWPELPVFTGSAEKERQVIKEKYANAPVENYTPFVEDTAVQLRAEPPVETQKMYLILDVVMQKILTDPFADVEQSLIEAEREFQTFVLDKL